MRLDLAWGLQHREVEVDEGKLVALRRAPPAPALDDPAAAVRAALEKPVDYPPLRRALTPDDHVAVVIDEGMSQLTQLLIPLLEHIAEAGVRAEAITLVCLPPSSGQAWVDDLPEAFQDVRVEVHQPGDRRQLSYLATTRRGRRVYLNRTVVDADQTVVLARRRYDPVLGHAGAEAALFPCLTDMATLAELSSNFEAEAPGAQPWPLRREAAEVAWLLGAPFLVQVVEGAGDTIAGVLAGPIESSGHGQQLLDARWRALVSRPADLVVGTLSGDPARHRLDDFGRAFLAAARVVKPGGRIVLLSEASPPLTESFELLRRIEEPAAALKALEESRPRDHAAAFMWATAALQAKLYLLSAMPAEVVEELFVTPLEQAPQVDRLLAHADSFIYLPDAHKTLAVLA
jgi:nickel-dependent lactate racemase